MRPIFAILCALLISGQALANPSADLQEELAGLASQIYSPRTTIPNGPLLKEGITHSQVGLLTTRLAELGYYVSYTTTFTEEVGNAVEQFFAFK